MSSAPFWFFAYELIQIEDFQLTLVTRLSKMYKESISARTDYYCDQMTLHLPALSADRRAADRDNP